MSFFPGRHIGKVTTDPVPIPDTEKVEVNLKIDSKVKIRDDAKYVIGSSGLLGDLFVDVKPVEYPAGTPDSEKHPFIQDGARIDGAATVGLDELAQGAQPLLKKANDIADKLDDMMSKLNDQVLTGTSTDDLKETISKLREMVDNGDSMVKNAQRHSRPGPKIARALWGVSSMTNRWAIISPSSSPTSRRTAPSSTRMTALSSRKTGPRRKNK